MKSRTVRIILDTMGMVIGSAVDREWTDRNPVVRLLAAGRRRGGARLKKKNTRRPIPLTEAELMQLEDVRRTEMARIRLPPLFMAFCGLRRGEAFGLQRRGFDAAEDRLRVERIVTHGDVTNPKADSVHSEPVKDWVAEELRAYLRIKKVVAFDGSDWVFATRTGEPQLWNFDRACILFAEPAGHGNLRRSHLGMFLREIREHRGMTLNVIVRRAVPGGTVPVTEVHHLSVKDSAFALSQKSAPATHHGVAGLAAIYS